MSSLSDLWIPNGSVLPDDVRMAQKAIKAYDPNLELGVDKRTEQWVVLWSRAVGEAPYPVLGLGFELPGYEEIQRRLYAGDVRRRGGEIVKEVNKRQEAARKARKDEAHEAAGDTAEALEHAFHRAGETSYKRIYIPRSV